MKAKIHIAHSALLDKEKNKDIPAQSYQDHVSGVYQNCLRSIDRLEKFVHKDIFPILRKSVLLAAIYHDLGKLDKQSQSCLHGDIKDKMLNHVDAGVAYLLSQYSKNGDTCYLISAYLILAHHIGLPNYNKMFKSERQLLSYIVSPRPEFRDRKSLAKYSMGKGTVKVHVDKKLKSYLKAHKKLVELDETTLGETKNSMAMLFLSNPYMLKTAIGFLVDADNEDTSTNYGDDYPIKMLDINGQYFLDNLLKKVEKLSCDFKNGLIPCSKERFELRQEFFKICGETELLDDFYLVDGTVGIGKTLAIMELALRLAIKYGSDKIIFMLPYIALIDQSAMEYIDSIFIPKDKVDHNLSVIHSVFRTKSVFHRKYAKGFNAPINLTTSVNFFNIIASNHTWAFKNITKFVGSVIVIDEYPAIASYEFWPTIIKIMKDMVKYFSCKFVYSSGTPVRFWEIEEIEKIINDTFKVKQVIPDKMYKKMMVLENGRVKITNSMGEEWDFNRLATEVISVDKSVFIILNTRKKAVAFAAALMNKTDRTVYLRFSGSVPEDRSIQFEEIKEKIKKEPIIVVATQGSDIGLNISFFVGFKELSSYDSISQMKGRINRGCEYTGSFLHVFKLCKEPNGDGVEYKNNPSFKRQAAIFELEKELHKSVSPEYSTYIASKEIVSMPKDAKDQMSRLCHLWNSKSFEDFGDEFALINMPMIHLLIDDNIFEKMKRGVYVPYNEIQANIVNLIWGKDVMDKLKDKIVLIDDELKKIEEEEEKENEVEDGKKKKHKHFGLYYWKGVYDSKNFGIFADPIFGLLKLKTLIA